MKIVQSLIDHEFLFHGFKFKILHRVFTIVLPFSNICDHFDKTVVCINYFCNKAVNKTPCTL